MVSKINLAYEAARKLTKFHAKSFYFSSFALPSMKRRHAYAVYALCRHIDDRIDEAGPDVDLSQRVAELRAMLARVYEGRADATDDSLRPWHPALRETVRSCDIPMQYFEELIEGVEMDQGAVRIVDWEQLDRYCYLVAGVVGLIMTRIFGLQDRTHEKEAIDLGRAMQLTNILRDVREDLERDRVYLPEDELRRFHLQETDLAAGRVTKEWREFMQFQIHRARENYQSSERGIAALPDDGSRRTVWVMRDVYAGILEEIERVDYDVFRGRVHVSFPRKCGLVAARWLGLKSTAVSG